MAGLRFLPGKTLSATLVMWAVSIAHIMAADTDIVINEIMYHPPLDMDELQYVELYNRGTAPVDLSKWTFARGIKFTFPDKTVIAPGGFLVVCRQLDVFTANYGKVPVLGNFTGKISHRGEKIELHNAAGAVVDGLKFSDQAPWPMGPDGYSASLERISPSGPSEDPANWAGSALPKSQKPAGTPGRKNDNFAAVMPPGIANVRISASAPMQPTTVTADVEDPQGIKGVSILCHYARSGGETPDKEAQMQRISGDEKKGTYQATIEGVAAGKLVRLRVKAQS